MSTRPTPTKPPPRPTTTTAPPANKKQKALTADRNYKLLAKAYPYMARRLLTDPAPELRASFEVRVLVCVCVEGGGVQRVCL